MVNPATYTPRKNAGSLDLKHVKHANGTAVLDWPNGGVMEDVDGVPLVICIRNAIPKEIQVSSSELEAPLR